MACERGGELMLQTSLGQEEKAKLQHIAGSGRGLTGIN